ncbi:hypothetical protein GCM10007147_30600 [Nocardiopsis kunsanensis]|uniref:Uncharacterized protein n=1 Tax=Nocardiopsis kunsanensis TaxID=141693 RepID=A0A918XFC5_9ACTN|nr:hypothetical protein GCM10007147_30600 [Nocardiopsis kunsanensis]
MIVSAWAGMAAARVRPPKAAKVAPAWSMRRALMLGECVKIILVRIVPTLESGSGGHVIHRRDGRKRDAKTRTRANVGCLRHGLGAVVRVMPGNG